MARRQYKTPFAATGDVVSVPDAVQPDGSVSLQQGYGFDYQRDPDTDPLAKVFPRDVHNGLLNEITASIGEIQQNGYPIWVEEGAPYPINAVVRHNDVNWQSNIDNNNDEPGVGAGATRWKVSGSQAEKFNAPIATIASAATVNLTTGAPDTSQITISGSVAITGFTVAANRTFIAKFTGTPLLTNSAAIVTGRGANIQIAAGDSVVIRSTAANVVEILPIDLLADASVGTRGQTWQDVTGSRGEGVTYTNTTGRPIQIFLTFDPVGAGSHFQVDGVDILPSTDTLYYQVSCIVPAGSTYRMNAAGASFNRKWVELR